MDRADGLGLEAVADSPLSAEVQSLHFPPNVEESDAFDDPAVALDSPVHPRDELVVRIRGGQLLALEGRGGVDGTCKLAGPAKCLRVFAGPLETRVGQELLAGNAGLEACDGFSVGA